MELNLSWRRPPPLPSWLEMNLIAQPIVRNYLIKCKDCGWHDDSLTKKHDKIVFQYSSAKPDWSFLGFNT